MRFNKIISMSLVGIMMFSAIHTAFADYHNTGQWGDQSNGTYTNPVLPYDYSDPDPQTVREYVEVEDPSKYPQEQRYRYEQETNDYVQDNEGGYIAQDVYYMVSSTFTKSGLGVLLRSYDMVNWETVNHIFKDATLFGSKYNWDNAGVPKDGGMWAPSFRYIEYKDETGYTHRRFMVHTTGADDGFFVAYTEDDPTGDWTTQALKDMYGNEIRAKRWDDCCPVWNFNEDGTIKDAYFIASCNNRAWYSHIFKLSADGTQLLDGDFNYMRPWDNKYQYTAGDATRMRTGETPERWSSYEHYDGIESGNPTDGAILLWNGDGYFDTDDVKNMFESETFSNDGYTADRQNYYSETYDSYEEGHCLIGDEADAKTLDVEADNYKEYYSIRHYKMTEAQVDALLASGAELKGNKEDGSIYKYIAFPCGYDGYSGGSRDETTPNTKYHAEQWFKDREVFIPNREGTVICDRRQTEANKAYKFTYQGKYDEKPEEYYYWFSNMRVRCPKFEDEKGWINDWNSGSVSSGEGEYLVPVMYRAKSPYGDIYTAEEDGSVTYTPGTPTRPGSFEFQQLFTGGEWGEPSQGGYLILNDDMATDGHISPENEPRMYVMSQYNVVQYTGRMDLLMPVTWVDGWPMWGVIDEPQYVNTGDYLMGRSDVYAVEGGIGEGQMISLATELWSDIEKPPVRLAAKFVEQGLTENPITSPQNGDDFSFKTELANDKGLSYDWQFYWQPRDNFYNLTERDGYLRMYAFEQTVENNFRKTGNVLSMRTVATDYLRQDVKMDISHMQNGQYAGISHNSGWGWNWTNIAVKMADNKKTIVYITGSNADASTANEIECANLPDDVTEIIFRGIAGSDRVNQFSYSIDNGETFEKCGNKYTLSSGVYAGDMLSLFTYNNNASTKEKANGEYTYIPTESNNYGYVDFDYFDYTYLRCAEDDSDMFTKVELVPIMDATLHAGSGDTNYGDSTQLQLGANRRAILKFDLSNIKEQLESGKIIDDAVLNLFKDYGNSQPGVKLYFVENDDWDEAEATYNNLVGNNTIEIKEENLLQDSTSISYGNDPGAILSMGTNALINHIKEEAVGDGILTLYLDYETYNSAMGFTSKDQDEKSKPNLTITLVEDNKETPKPEFPYTLSAIISDDKLTGINVVNNYGEVAQGRLFAARYDDDGTLLEVHTELYTEENNEYVFDKSMNAAESVLYFWDNNMKPIAKAVKVISDQKETETQPTASPTVSPTASPTTAPTDTPIQVNSYWGDNGDGTFTNPVLPMDYSDPDIIRVDNDYYMVSSSFMDYPGTTVLHSTDLVNWETAGYAIENPADFNSHYSYDKMDWYGYGVYAPSIRYHEGKFYVYSPIYNNGGILVSIAEKAEGPWTTQFVKDKDGSDIKIEKLTDLCPFWDDENNCAYMLLSNLGSSTRGIDVQLDGNSNTGNAAQLFKMSLDGITLTDCDASSADAFANSGVVIRNIVGTEGNKLYKKDGYYYIFNCDFQGKSADGKGPYVRRAKNIYGDVSAEDKKAFNYETDGAVTNGEYTYHHGGYYETVHLGTGAILQGGFVDTPNGDWYFMGQTGAYTNGGREPWLVEVTWNEGEFPSMDQTPASTSKVVNKPIESSVVKYSVGSDDFNGDALSINWNWNHQPNADYYALTDGKLRLSAQPRLSGGFWGMRNVINQKYVNTEYVDVSAKLDLSGMQEGQEAGIAHFNGGTDYVTLGVYVSGGKKYIALDNNGNITEGVSEYIGSEIYFRTIVDSVKTAHMYYSADNENWVKAGTVTLPTADSHYYKGDRIGLYTYNDSSDSGYVDFDYFNYDFTGPAWSGEIPQLPTAEDMEVREDYPYEAVFEFENTLNGTYESDSKTYVTGTSQATVSENTNASGGRIIDNTKNNDIIYLGDFTADYLSEIIISVGTKRNDAKAEFYAVPKENVQGEVSAETLASWIGNGTKIGESSTLKADASNWNAYKDNYVTITGTLTGEYALMVKLISSGSNFVGNFDNVTLCYSEYPFNMTSEKVYFKDILNADWTNQANSDGTYISSTKKNDLFDLGIHSLDNLVKININAALKNATAEMTLYKLDQTTDISSLDKSQLDALLSESIAVVPIAKTAEWTTYNINSVNLNGLSGEYRIIAKITAASGSWGGNYDYIEFCSKSN